MFQINEIIVNFKTYLKSTMPDFILQPIIQLHSKVNLIIGYIRDYLRFRKSDLTFANKLNGSQLVAKMTLHYHSVEKGLSRKNIRLGFGHNAITELINSMNRYYRFGHDLSHPAYLTSLSVINEYIKIHQLDNEFTQSEWITSLKNDLSKLTNLSNIDELGGVYNLSRKETIKNTLIDFETLSWWRFSVRDFSYKPLTLYNIEKAIIIASKTPSVCNRQAWHTYLIRNKETIKTILFLQGGLIGQGENIDSLILVTSNNYALNTYRERNQGFIDSGMYSMSLLYALTSLGIASCPLNVNMPFSREDQVRNILSIPFHQNLTMFIAIGSYPEVFKVPKSKRFDLKSIYTQVN
jgi:nitroreductase